MKALCTAFILTIQLFSGHLPGQSSFQNNILQGRVLYQSSGNKPAAGVHIKEKDSNGDYSKDDGVYRLTFQSKRNGATLAIEVGSDNKEGKKIELVNEKELKSAKLPASAEEFLDIIVCPAGQRDLAAQKYYRILRTSADLELDKKKKEVEALLAQREKDYQKISGLFAQIDRMQAALDSAKIREQAFNIASINLDRASQLVREAVKKIDEEDDVEGALRILNAEALDTAYEHASAIKRHGEAIVKKADSEIRQVIEGYEFKISLLKPQYKYGEISECYEKIAAIFEKEDYDDEGLATNLKEAATNRGLNGNYQKQLELNLNAIAIREKILPADDRDMIRSYLNLALAYGNLGDYQKQLEWNLKVITILGDSTAVQEPVLALSYNNLAAAYGALGDFQNQLKFHLKAAQIRERCFLSDHPDLATSYNNISLAYGNLGQYQKQLDYVLKALDINERILTANHPNLATMYNNLALAYGKLGNYEDALKYNLKALSIQEKILPENHPRLAAYYNGIAYTYSSLGEFNKSLEYALKAMPIYEKNVSPNHPNLALLYNNIGVTYTDLDQPQTALEYHMKALVIQERNLPPNHPHLASTFTNICRTYRNMGDYKNGIEYAQKAVQIGEISDPKLPALNLYYLNLGITYINACQFPEAKTALEKSEDLKPGVGVYRGWAMYYAARNKKQQALKSLQKAVSLGFKDLKWLETEPELKNIREEKEYKDLIEQMRRH